MDALLNTQSGLLGLSELSNDCRELEAAAEHGHAGAQLALEVFVHRLARYIGGLAMALRRLDAVVFTGGIGENSVRVRAMTLARLRPLGFALDAAANACMTGGGGGVISASGATPCAAVVATNEEWMIACDTAGLARQAAGVHGGRMTWNVPAGFLPGPGHPGSGLTSMALGLVQALRRDHVAVGLHQADHAARRPRQRRPRPPISPARCCTSKCPNRCPSRPPRRGCAPAGSMRCWRISSPPSSWPAPAATRWWWRG